MDADFEKPIPRRRRGAVMSDVGRLAGVSHQTVSRVINGSSHVRPETRERVLAAMRELDYRPNPVARALVTGRSNTLGVVTFDTTLYGPASTLCGIERAAHETGYFIIVASLKALDRSSLVDAIDRLQLHGVDGILVIAPYQEAADALADAPQRIPIVAVEAGPPDAVPLVSVDQVAGAMSATRHLLDLGHETVWHVAGPRDFLEARQRLDGWRSTLESAGAEVPVPLEGDWSARAGYDLGRRLSRDRAVTAVFVANDQMALGALRAMHEAGRAIPDEVSIVGFDDIPEAPYFTPPLTTIRQDFDDMGSRGVRLLLRTIEGREPAAPGSKVQPDLIVRASTTVSPRG
ncbi:MAG: LacI family DNA-binding transcriptional regulator [Solirubrobacterales bacterium]|nr:LacI family DNA-binding transcriptional regulator [Solirubrobacterales bacterium]MBV9800256.1 LacI family DNA-binding transcriptional regulator [Solirubrobacterales bacterium]